MKRYIFCLAALVFIACDKEWNDINPRRVNLSDVTLECISEVAGVHDTISGLEYTHHTYMCTGTLSGFTGNCHIVIREPIMGECGGSGELIVSGNKTDFAFTFTNRGDHTDFDYFNYTIQVVDEYDYVLCQTNIIASKHPERPNAEMVDVPFVEYSLWGTTCEWQLPQLNNSVIIVNSNEELARYIQSESQESYPSVDFEKYTMIIAHGGTPQGIYDTIVESLQQVSETEYQLNIDVVMTMTDAPELWTKALLVDKWDKLHNIVLCVDYRELIN